VFLRAAVENANSKLTSSVQAEFIDIMILNGGGDVHGHARGGGSAHRAGATLLTKLGERTNMKTLVATLAITMGVAAPAAAADLDEDDYGNEHYGAVAVAPVAPVAPVVVAPVEPVVVAPVARVYVPPPPVYVAPVARVYAAPYYHRRYLGYGGGWDHAGWGHGGWGHGGWGHGGWRHGGWGRPHW
jgi:hypothetical protein